jgi:L-ribulose-5-phosphate 3-epimerase
MNFKGNKRISNSSRRRFLAAAAAVAASPSLWAAETTASPAASEEKNQSSTKICIFSKHLQWLDYRAMAQTVAGIGFDGVDLTVRPGGHVRPERVQQDLPEAVRAVKAAGLDVPMITTSITKPDDALTESTLAAASGLGIRYYRMGYYRYEDSKTIPQTLSEARPMLRGLVEMNKHYNIAGTYQNHSGSRYVGAPVWDLYQLLRDLDTRWIGCQFDIRHATVEGGTVWPTHFRLMSGCINTLVAKDFRWAQDGDTWKPENCPLGEGMVDFTRYFRMLRQAKTAAPMSLHLEYPLGGAEHGAASLTVAKDRVLEAMRKDLRFLRKRLA